MDQQRSARSYVLTHSTGRLWDATLRRASVGCGVERTPAMDQSIRTGPSLPCGQRPVPFGVSAAQRQVRQPNTIATVRAVPREVDGSLARQYILKWRGPETFLGTWRRQQWLSVRVGFWPSTPILRWTWRSAANRSRVLGCDAIQRSVPAVHDLVGSPWQWQDSDACVDGAPSAGTRDSSLEVCSLRACDKRGTDRPGCWPTSMG